MKKIFLGLLASVLLPGIVAAAELKVLTIGNSFSNSVFTFLPDIAKSFPDCKLLLDRANLGGCSLERHWKLFVKTEKDPDHKAYYVYGDKSVPHYSLQSKLVEHKWDIIVIQQVSTQSWKQKSYEPYAGNLIKAIKKLAPQAEIVIQQTWSYRADAPQFMPGHAWGFDQNGMYERLADCYRKLAEKYKLRVIPVGLAVQHYRQNTPKKFKICPPAELKKFKRPALPDETGDIVGKMAWRPKDRKNSSGEWYIRTDYKHLNVQGHYMQACVWFAFLFDKKCSDIKYIPKKSNMTPADLELLKKCAQSAIDSYTQVQR